MGYHVAPNEHYVSLSWYHVAPNGHYVSPSFLLLRYLSKTFYQVLLLKHVCLFSKHVYLYHLSIFIRRPSFYSNISITSYLFLWGTERESPLSPLVCLSKSILVFLLLSICIYLIGRIPPVRHLPTLTCPLVPVYTHLQTHMSFPRMSTLTYRLIYLSPHVYTHLSTLACSLLPAHFHLSIITSPLSTLYYQLSAITSPLLPVHYQLSTIVISEIWYLTWH